MSSTFDTMQTAVAWLAHYEGEDEERRHQVARYLRMVIDRLHDLHHTTQRIDAAQLNQVAGPQIACLDIILTEDDPETRQLRLQARESRR